MATKSFEYVAFWDTCAWAVGTTCVDLVCQGATIEQAVQRLSHSAYAEATIATREGRTPFAMRPAIDKFSNTADAIPTPPPTALFSKAQRYKGTFEISWKDALQASEHVDNG
jgi:hypothetical protein